MVSRSFFFLSSLTLLTVAYAQTTLTFDDVTQDVGVVQDAGKFKWGGPCVADLDGDGIYDLVLSFHASAQVQIYWGQPNGNFQRQPFFERGDTHGITVAYRTTDSRQRLLAISKGGGRGNFPNPPSMYLISPNRRITNVTNRFGLGQIANRGRVALFMDLSMADIPTRRMQRKGPGALVLGFVSGMDNFPQRAYENIRGFFAVRTPLGFEDETEGRVAVADVNGDGVVEVISNPGLQIYELVAPFTFQDITASLFGSDLPLYDGRNVATGAEFDFNNDGVFDLYLARALRSDLLPISDTSLQISDVLFKQTPGGLVDISSTAGIPTGIRSSGVTTGDFDNNGFIDVFVATFEGLDFFLMNNGNETFTRVERITPKDAGIPGGNAVAVDYDQDGRLDLIVRQGGEKDIGGPYRILRNVNPISEQGNYLLVGVGTHPFRAATSLHAVVTVKVGSMRMTRRVGSPGTQRGGPSYLDTVHFGLGAAEQVDWVRVRWEAGKAFTNRFVAANQKITFGRV